jgi:single-strand DNA-binding protein
MNRVVLTGRLTRNPESRSLASGKTVTTFSIATNDYRGGSEKAEYHPVVTWDRLAEICGQFLAKGSLVCIEGRLQTRQWEDDAKTRHWKTEIVASAVEMLSGKRKKDYAAESAATALEAQATAMGFVPANDVDESDSDDEISAEIESEEEELVAA